VLRERCLHDILRPHPETLGSRAVAGGKLGDLPVLAERTPEIAAHDGNGKGGGAGQEMVEGLFFDGVDVGGDQVAVGMGPQFPVPILAHAADAEPPARHPAAMIAEAALDVALIAPGTPEHGFLREERVPPIFHDFRATLSSNPAAFRRAGSGACADGDGSNADCRFCLPVLLPWTDNPAKAG